MARFIVTAKGYDNITLRQPGEIIDLPEGAKGSWFEPYSPEGAKALKAKQKVDNTPSEAATGGVNPTGAVPAPGNDSKGSDLV